MTAVKVLNMKVNTCGYENSGGGVGILKIII